MSDTLLVALVQGGFTLIGGALLLVLGARLNGKVKAVQADAKATRHQVENDHTINFREDQDDKHHENSSKLDTLLEKVEAIELSVIRLWRRDKERVEWQGEIDAMTHPRNRFAPGAKHRQDEQ